MSSSPLHFSLPCLSTIAIFAILFGGDGTNAFLGGGCAGGGCAGGGCTPSCCVVKQLIPFPFPVPCACSCCAPPSCSGCCPSCCPCQCGPKSCAASPCCCGGPSPCPSPSCCSSSQSCGGCGCCSDQKQCCSSSCCSSSSSSCCSSSSSSCCSSSSSSCCSSSSSFTSSSTFFAAHQSANNFAYGYGPIFGCGPGGGGGPGPILGGPGCGSPLGCAAGGGPRPVLGGGGAGCAGPLGCGAVGPGGPVVVGPRSLPGGAGCGGGPVSIGAGLPMAVPPMPYGLGYGPLGMAVYGAGGPSGAGGQSPPTVYVIGGSPLIGSATRGANASTTTANPEEIQSEIESSLGPKGGRRKGGKGGGDGGSNNSGMAGASTGRGGNKAGKPSVPTGPAEGPEEVGPAEEVESSPSVPSGGGQGVNVATPPNAPMGGGETEVPAAAKETEIEENNVGIGAPNNNNQSPASVTIGTTAKMGNYPPAAPPNQTFREGQENEGGGEGTKKDLEEGDEYEEDEEAEDYGEEDEEEEEGEATKKKRKKAKKWKAAASKLLKMAERAGERGLYERRDRLLRRLKKKLNFRRAKRVSNGGKERGTAKGKRRCNSPKLGRVIGRAIVEQVSIAKRLVRRAMEHAYPRLKFDVICSSEADNFSYSFYARRYCEVARRGIACVVFD